MTMKKTEKPYFGKKDFVSVLAAYLFFYLCCVSHTALAQDSCVQYLLKRIEQQQIVEDNFFLPGIFPSYISNRENFKTKRKDNNIFYNALTLFTLKRFDSFFTPQEKILFDSIYQRSLALFPKFRNKQGRFTYNFWRTDSAYNFPYTKWIKWIKKSTALPDDMDDTVLSLMVLGTNDSMATAVHTFMQQYINKYPEKAMAIPKNYQVFPAYSTWFGKNFPTVFDVCVLTNLLYFVEVHDLLWTKADSASLQVLLAAIHNNDYLQSPLQVSPYYGKTSLILYHLARLMSVAKIDTLEKLKPQLIQQAMNRWQTSSQMLEKLILSITLLQWNVQPPDMEFCNSYTIQKQIEESDYSFFIGNIPSYFNQTYKNWFYRNGWGLFYHYCPAFNDALLIEYLILKYRKLTNAG